MLFPGRQPRSRIAGEIPGMALIHEAYSRRASWISRWAWWPHKTGLFLNRRECRSGNRGSTMTLIGLFPKSRLLSKQQREKTRSFLVPLSFILAHNNYTVCIIGQRQTVSFCIRHFGIFAVSLKNQLISTEYPSLLYQEAPVYTDCIRRLDCSIMG